MWILISSSDHSIIYNEDLVYFFEIRNSKKQVVVNKTERIQFSFILEKPGFWALYKTLIYWKVK